MYRREGTENNYYYVEDPNGTYTEDEIKKYVSNWDFKYVTESEKQEIMERLERLENTDIIWLIKFQNKKQLSGNTICCNERYIIQNFKSFIYG